MSDTLYTRLGGYDAIVAVVNDLLPRLASDPALGRFWKHRGEDGVLREKQLLIDFLCASAGGPLYYTGRDMKTSHRGMRIRESVRSSGMSRPHWTSSVFPLPNGQRCSLSSKAQSRTLWNRRRP